jgi:hypothetical protein
MTRLRHSLSYAHGDNRGAVDPTAKPDWNQKLPRAIKTSALFAAACIAIAVSVLVVPARAESASSVRYYWTGGRAERILEGSYHQPDQVALMEAGRAIIEAPAIGSPTALRRAQAQAAAARRGFTVDFASCLARGTPWHTVYYRNFRCKLNMSSTYDVQTIFLTVHVVGRSTYRINNSRKIWNR